MPTKTKAPEETVPAPPDWDAEKAPDPEEIEGTYDDVTDGPLASSALVPTSQSVIVGLGALAALSDEEYNQKKMILQRGLERVKDIQINLMIEREDYGKVKGIKRPFLQLPGAEKLALFYGYAVRQEADRVVGNFDHETSKWLSPPLAYHVRSYVHLGSFDGPVVAMGYGEANSWEEKYRYRFAKATCPNCGREGLIKGRPDGQLKGNWWCPGREGGCNQKFEPGSISPPGKVENDEPYDQAETLIQMAGKRSFVAAIRRATGTSGLFTQDEDSPSVIAQSQESGPDETVGEPVVTAGPAGVEVGVGAKSHAATEVQINRLGQVAKDKGLKGADIAALIERLFDIKVERTGKAASAAVKNLTGEQVGRLLYTIETGDVMPEDHKDERAPDDTGAQ